MQELEERGTGSSSRFDLEKNKVHALKQRRVFCSSLSFGQFSDGPISLSRRVDMRGREGIPTRGVLKESAAADERKE